MKSPALFTLLACFSIAAMTATARGHEEDFTIGSDVPGGGALKMETGSIFPIALPLVHGLIEGWALDDPGFNTLETDEPDEDIYVLNAASRIVMRVLSLDPDFKAYIPGFADTLDAPGENWLLGQAPFDTHPTWHIDPADPDYAPGRPFWSFEFRLEDNTGHYQPSAPFAATFTPEPGTMLLIGVGVVAMILRRRP